MLYLTRPANKIYIMSSPAYPGRIKVGVSNRPDIRAKQVGQSKSGRMPKHAAKVVFQIGMPCAYKVEGFFHALYAPLNAPTKGDGRTEWFTAAPLCFVAGMCAMWFGQGDWLELSALVCGVALLAYLAFVAFTALLLCLVRAVFELAVPGVLWAIYHFLGY